MFEDYTAVELAEGFDRVPDLSPEHTGPLSALDEAALRWTLRHPELREAHAAFAEARAKQYPRTRSEQTWEDVKSTAAALAEKLRGLGDARLELCQAKAGWGTCNLALPESGECRLSNEHLPD